MKMTGVAMIHAKKPMAGIADRAQIMPRIPQLAIMVLLLAGGDGEWASWFISVMGLSE